MLLMNKKYVCCLTGKEISEARAEVLIDDGVPEDEMTCLEAAQQTVRRKKMVSFDEDAVDLHVVDYIGDEALFDDLEALAQEKEIEQDIVL